MYFCCESGLVGYANRETFGFGEMCLESGITTETAGGADTLAVSSVGALWGSWDRADGCRLRLVRIRLRGVRLRRWGRRRLRGR